MTNPFALTTIALTDEQTAIYDGGDDLGRDEMMRPVLAYARQVLAESGEPVLVETSDGIAIEFLQ
jgi:hypothetical protein